MTPDEAASHILHGEYSLEAATVWIDWRQKHNTNLIMDRLCAWLVSRVQTLEPSQSVTSHAPGTPQKIPGGVLVDDVQSLCEGIRVLKQRLFHLNGLRARVASDELVDLISALYHTAVLLDDHAERLTRKLTP